MPSFPSSLPGLAYGWTETPLDNVARFQPDVGGPKFRRRSTANGSMCSGAFRLSNDDVAIFRAFYEFDLKDGSLPFIWDHPVTGQSTSWAFEEPPQFNSETRGMTSVSVKLRRLP